MTEQGITPTQQRTMVQTFPNGNQWLQSSNRLPFLSVIKGLGITQMVVGSICILMSVIGIVLKFRYSTFYDVYGTGVWAGTYFFVTGLVGVLAHNKESHCLIISCMVMNIISCMIGVAGEILALIESHLLVFPSAAHSVLIYQQAKCYTITALCILELVISTVNASFTCASYCLRRLPPEPSSSSPNASRIVAAQPGYQTDVLLRQDYLDHGYLRLQAENSRQMMAFPWPPDSSTQPVHPQQRGMFHSSVNPAFTRECPSGVTAFDPPPSSRAAEPNRM